MTEEKLPPQDLLAERMVLSGCFISDRIFYNAIENLEPEYFYSSGHRVLFERLKKEKKRDIIIFQEEIEKANSVFPDLSDSIAEYGCSISGDTEIEIIIEAHKRRQGIESCLNAVNAYYNDDDIKATDISSKLIGGLLGGITARNESLKRMGLLLGDEFERLRAVTSGEKTAFVETGLKTIDSKIYIQKNDYIIIGARPSQGKSSLAGKIARNLGKCGKTVLVINLESSNENELSRALFSEARVNLNNFNLGFWSKKEMEKLKNAADPLRDINVFLDDNPLTTPSKLYATAQKIKHEVGSLDLVVIDYLQLMMCDSAQKDERLRVAEISRSLKLMTKQIGCPVVALSQLSRYPNEETEPPTKRHLRETGNIEADADKIFLLYTPGHYRKKDEKGAIIDDNLMEFYIAKYKNGKIGKINLNFNREFFDITDREDGREDDRSCWQD